MGAAVSPASNLKEKTPGKLCQDATRQPRTREVTSRYLSTSPSSSSNSASSSSTLSSSHQLSSRRCPSPCPAMVKRSQSAERRRPVALGLDGAPSGVSLNRSMSVSFQEESFSVPINKLKPTSPPKLRKSTPERISMTPVATTPRKLQDRDQIIGINRIQCVGTSQAVDRNRSILTLESEASDSESNSVKDSVSSPQSQTRPQINTLPVRLGTTLPRSNPVKAAGSSIPRGNQTSRGVSPLRSTIKPCSPRPSPGKNSLLKAADSSGRFSSAVTGGSADSTSRISQVLCLPADARWRKSGDNRVADTHLLRLLYNQHLQWRFANAKADAALAVQQTSAEGTLFNAWRATTELRISVYQKRSDLARLTLKLKLTSILQKQMKYLDEWAIMEKEHSSFLQGVLVSLKASVDRLPVVDGAMVDVNGVQNAMLSAYDVLQAMLPIVCSLLSKVELMHTLLSEMAAVTHSQHRLLVECKDSLSALAALQVVSQKAGILQGFSLAYFELGVSSATTLCLLGQGYGLLLSNPPQTLLLMGYTE